MGGMLSKKHIVIREKAKTTLACSQRNDAEIRLLASSYLSACSNISWIAGRVAVEFGIVKRY